MSAQARLALANHPHFLLRLAVQRSDILDPNKTQTELIALCLELVGKGHIIEVTALNSDHSNDADLGKHSHHNGFGMDCWFNASPRLGDYLDVSDHRFQSAVYDAGHSQWTWQEGLGGEADTAQLRADAGPTFFDDNGSDHVHVGANG